MTIWCRFVHRAARRWEPQAIDQAKGHFLAGAGAVRVGSRGLQAAATLLPNRFQDATR